MLKISIPVPCHEDWNKMTLDETGRHCSSCAKSVVDFTAMSDEEVKYFFLNKKEERVCGRFKQTQLHRIVIELPQNIFSIQMPIWKKFLAACLVVFSTTLFSCETKIKGEPEIHVQTQELKSGTTTSEHVMVGGIGFSITPDSIKTFEVCPVTVGITFVPPIVIDTPKVLTGDIEIIESDPLPQNLPDTVPVLQLTNDIIFTGDTIYQELPIKKLKVNAPDTATKTKNPPKADSINCNTIKNYYEPSTKNVPKSTTSPSPILNFSRPSTSTSYITLL